MKPSNWINPTAKSNGPPPKHLSGFLKWALSGSFTVLVFSGMISIITGMMDVSAALILGLMIDSALTSTSGNLFEGKFLLYVTGSLDPSASHALAPALRKELEQERWLQVK